MARKFFRTTVLASDRPGRFSFTSSGTPQLIIDGRVPAIRVFNSGENEFDVRTAGSSYAVLPNSSVDITTGPATRIAAAAGKEVSGVYEVLTPARDVRSGRVRLSSTGPTEAMFARVNRTPTGALGAQDRVYRLLNSSAAPVTIPGLTDVNTAAPAPTTPTLADGDSIDFVVASDALVEGANAEVIYFSLQSDANVRSGRFSTVDKKYLAVLKGLDTASDSKVAAYRMFNSMRADSDPSIKISIVSTEDVSVIRRGPFTLAPRQSIDFRVQDFQAIVVESTDSNAVEGILDLVAII